MIEPVWATVEGIERQFEPLAAEIVRVDGIQGVQAVFNYETRGLTPEGWGSELIIIVSAAAGALGQKALDLVADLVKDYLKTKFQGRQPGRGVTIYDQNGKVIKRVPKD